MDKDFELLVKKYLKEGNDINIIQETFDKMITKNSKNLSTKKTKKNRKRICRPVLLISDSSCDEFETI